MKSSKAIRRHTRNSVIPLDPERRTSSDVAPHPVVIICHEAPDLARLMEAYIGRARMVLLPDLASATTLANSLRDNNIRILAILGFPGNPASIPFSFLHAEPDLNLV